MQTDKGPSAGPLPLLKAGLLSTMTFSWASALMAKGKMVRKKEDRELELEDIWDLPDKNQANNLYDYFQQTVDSLEKKKDYANKTEDERLAVKRSVITVALWRVVYRDMVISGLLRLLTVFAVLTYPLALNKVLVNVQEVARSPDDASALQNGFIWVFVFGAALSVSAIAENSSFFYSLRAVACIRSVLCTAVYRKTICISAASRQMMTAGEIVNLMQLDAEGIAFTAMSFHSVWSALLQIIGFMVTLYWYIDWTAFTSLGVIAIVAPFIALGFSLLVRFQTRWAKQTDKRVLQTNEILQSMQGVKMGGWEIRFANAIKATRKTELKATFNTSIVNAINGAIMRVMPTITAIVALSVYASSDLGESDAATLFTALAAFNLLRRPLQMLPNALTAFGEGLVRRRRMAIFLSLQELKDRKSVKSPEDKLQPAEEGSVVVNMETEQQKDVPLAIVASENKDSKTTSVISISNGEFFWADPANHQSSMSELSGKKKEKKEKKPTKKQQAADRKKADRSTAATNNIQVIVETPEDPSTPTKEDDKNANRAALTGVNLDVSKGALVGICGPVASGKSSLCAAIISEMHKSAGTVDVQGSFAFAAQSPWIFHASIRDNILFGLPYDDKKYKRTLQACQLIRDLELLEEGDQTIVGEQGINLSGGQKARLSLARAAYSERDVIILDDPLSALDPGVAGKVFNDCIVKLLGSRTRILVTNMLNMLPKCDHVVVLGSNEGEPGRIIEQGTYENLFSADGEFSKLMKAFHGDGSHDEDTEKEGDEGEEEEEAVVSKLDKGTALMEVEERQKGAVGAEQYKFYAQVGGGTCLAATVATLFILQQGAQIGNQAWVSYWTEDEFYVDNSLQFYLIGYGLTGVGYLVLLLGSVIALMMFAVRASRVAHNQLLDSVLRAPMSFFDSTPTGRIVSRFAKDTNQLDQKLPENLFHFSLVCVAVVMSFAVIGYTTPLFLIMFPLLAPIYISILQYYRPTIRDVRRLESISRSPIYSHFSESISGLITIRAYGVAEEFVESSATKIDQNIRIFLHVIIAQIWLFIRLSLMGAFITVGAGCFAILAARAGALSAGLVGLSLTLAITATDLMAAVVSSVSHVETSFNAVERIRHYIKNIPQEKPFTSANPPPQSWPSSGEIVIKDLKMRYRPNLPLVLKGLSLTIKGGERVGVVGRTGCGKSSLMLSLLRLVEPEALEDGSGPVRIDGIDVSQIGLHELRSKIGIVPQNPMLFSGTIRSNLDPFDSYSDEALWAALESCTLKESIDELGGLDSSVSEFGENLSQGQRQLLVLARATLNDTRILLLDEATSSLDHATDALIQSTLRKNFASATCITIAHRLLTVADSDRILVLDSGNVLEYGSPRELLDQPDSAFTSMVAELGPSMAASLKSSTQLK